jgi:hypothetical protein
MEALSFVAGLTRTAKSWQDKIISGDSLKGYEHVIQPDKFFLQRCKR